jgi:aminoglycoside phosphotransferase family enzyme/predicted kinase
MKLDRLIEALSVTAAYPHPADSVVVCHTHISVVFLAGPYAYKVKKPVNLGFLDFSTLDRRKHFCEQEVRLNRRLAPAIYLGVVPVTERAGRLEIDGQGPAVEWAVKMQRLPGEATLERQLERGQVTPEQVSALARRIAAFHAGAAGGPAVAEFGRFEVVAGNARENLDQVLPLLGQTISPPVHERLRALTEEHLHRLRPLIEARARRGVPRDTHGDLHLDHVYLLPGQDPVVVDCIEFNERFRHADPVADMAFLVMDFLFHGRKDLARVFSDAYFTAADDAEGKALLPFYTAYRAAVRGKVEGFELAEQEVPEQERQAAGWRARAHWLLALGELEAPDRKPCLVLLGGLPGTGKSTLARQLGEPGNFEVIRSDVVRKELAAHSTEARSGGGFGEGLYSPAWNARTYAECLRRAEDLLFAGRRVLVDASFRRERDRRAFLDLAQRWRVPAALLVCWADASDVRERLSARQGDASDANWSVYLRASEEWEDAGRETYPLLHRVVTTGSREEALARAVQVLRQLGLIT